MSCPVMGVEIRPGEEIATRSGCRPTFWGAVELSPDAAVHGHAATCPGDQMHPVKCSSHHSGCQDVPKCIP